MTVCVVPVPPVNVCAGCAVLPMYGVTTYPVTGLPLGAGSVQDSVAVVVPTETAVIAGAPGRA